MHTLYDILSIIITFGIRINNLPCFIEKNKYNWRVLSHWFQNVLHLLSNTGLFVLIIWYAFFR